MSVNLESLVLRKTKIHAVWIVLVSCLCLALIIGFKVNDIEISSGLKVVNDFEDWFKKDDASLLKYRILEERFEGDEYIIVSMKADSVFEERSLHAIAELTERFYLLPDVSKVVSLTNIDDVSVDAEGSIVIAPLFETIPQAQSELDAKKKSTLSDPLFVGNIVSQDGSATAMLLQISPNPKRLDYKTYLTDTVRQIVAEPAYKDYTFHLAGTAVLIAEENKANINDTLENTIYSIMVFICLLLYIFRHVAFVVIPLWVVSVAMIWVHGLMALLGTDLNVVTVLVGTMILVIGTSDSIHYCTIYQDKRLEGLDRYHASLATSKELLAPCFFTSVTTAAGFFSMMVSELIPIKDFAFFTGVAMILLYVTYIFFTPVLLTHLTPRTQPSLRESNLALIYLTNKLTSLNRKHSLKVLILSTIFVIFAISKIGEIEVNTNLKEYFIDSHNYPIAVDFIEENVTGTLTFEVMFDAEDGRLNEPAALRKMQKLQEYIEQQDAVIYTISAVDVLKEMNMSFNGEDRLHYRIPDSPELITQLSLLSSEIIESYIDVYDFSIARIHCRLKSIDSITMQKISTDIERAAADIFSGSDITVTLTGTMNLYMNASDYVVDSQIMGFAIALGTIFLFLLAMLRSLPLALLGMVPNLLPISLIFGCMGWFGIKLDVATAITSSVALGLAVNDTIHFLSRFRVSYEKFQDFDKALEQTFFDVGKPIIITTAILAIGFFIGTLATFKPIVYFGLLSGVAACSALLADLILLPALIRVFLPEVKPRVLAEAA